MSIVDVERLRRFMSSPEWTNDQKLAAVDVLDGLESTLETALHGAPISVRALVTEVCPIGETGQVFTDHPVFEVTAMDGVAVALTIGEGEEPDPVLDAPPWRLDPMTRRVHYADTAEIAPYGLSTYSSFSPVVAHTRAISQVSMTYRMGWGDAPALRMAILRKAKTMMINAHDDSLIARGTDATQPPPMPPEEWTEAELKPLGIYRSLTAWR